MRSNGCASEAMAGLKLKTWGSCDSSMAREEGGSR
jgi:hypothetical protein